MISASNRSREFVDHLVNVLLAQHVLSADFFYGIYCFCPELFLEGDDQRAFQLFSRLVRLFERSGSVPADIAQSSMEEFTTFGVDVRKRHVDSESSAEDIDDVLTFLADYSFMSRKHLVQIFKLCCLIVERLILLCLNRSVQLCSTHLCSDVLLEGVSEFALLCLMQTWGIFH